MIIINILLLATCISLIFFLLQAKNKIKIQENTDVIHRDSSTNGNRISDKNGQEIDHVDRLDMEENEMETKQYLIYVYDNQSEHASSIQLLLPHYTVKCSSKNEDSFNQILKTHPNVVMMCFGDKKKSSIELCKQIKNNPETEAIPIILYSDDISEVNQILGYRAQADHFLKTPLNSELLDLIVIQSLNLHDKAIMKQNHSEMKYDYGGMVMDTANDKLIKKVVDYIRENIEDNDLNVEKLSKEIGFSRVHLNRKLKDILGVSPSNLIKTIRLKQAAYLLVTKNANISEVAYKVGFSSHSYFTHNFHTYFGMSPKEFVVKYSDMDNDKIRKLLE